MHPDSTGCACRHCGAPLVRVVTSYRHNLVGDVCSVGWFADYSPFARPCGAPTTEAQDPRCYLLHLDPPLAHARHYAGIALDGDVPRRVRQHISGQGSPLIAAAVAAGCQVRVVLDVPGDRGLERRWHNAHGTRVCPECRPRRRRPAGRQLPLFGSTGAAHAAAPTPRRLSRAA